MRYKYDKKNITNNNWIYRILISRIKRKQRGDNQVNQTEYKLKEFLTKNELEFYNKLIKIEEVGDYKVIPQINLASIIKKESSNKFHFELYRNIDFAIFNKTLTNLIILIELNDSSHEQNKRKYRDIKVKEICDKAHIKLITFYTKYDNKEDYVIKKILENINKLTTKEEY